MLISCWIFGRLKSWASYSVYDLVFIWVLVASYRILSVSSLKFAGPSWHCLAQSLVQKVGIGLCMRPAHQFAQQRAGLVPGTQHQKKGQPQNSSGCWCRQVYWNLYRPPCCVLFWLVSVTPWKSRCLPSKSRKVEKFTCQEISARKVEKFEKIEKSKSRKVEKFEKFEKFEKSKTFWLFAKIFPGRVINSVGFGGIGAQAVSTHRAFYGCLVALSRSNGWLLSRGAGNLQSVYQN